MKSFEIEVDGQKIRGNLYLPAKASKSLAVLFLHGWTGRSNDNAAAFLESQGYYAMTISMRGHGLSDGDINMVSRQNSLDDAVAAYDYFAEQLPSGTGIVVVGNSYGGYIAELLSAERAVAAVSLRVSAAYPDEGFTRAQMGQTHINPDVVIWRTTPQSYEGNRGFEALHAFKGPIQIIEAEQDEIIPHQTIQNQRDAISHANVSYELMQGWPHSLGDHAERNKQFQTVLLHWLETIS